MANAWLDQGCMHRKSALLLAREWTALGHSIRIEHAKHKMFHVWLRVTRRKP